MILRQTIPYSTEVQLDTDRTTSLLEHFQQKMRWTCTKKYGFILDVLRIVQIKSRKISIYNGNIIIECIIEVDQLYPKVGQTSNGTVKQIFPQGIITIVKDCMKVFIPCDTRSISFKPEQIVNFKVVQTRFQKGKYDCIGQLLV
jgi:hypothetical protein